MVYLTVVDVDYYDGDDDDAFVLVFYVESLFDDHMRLQLHLQAQNPVLMMLNFS